MAYLDLDPVIVAIRERPAEFEMIRGNLCHLPSSHGFEFAKDGKVRVVADCDCASLSTRSDEAAEFKAAYDAWHANYWQAIEINREFAGHFRRHKGWRQACARILTYLLEHLQPTTAGARHSSACSAEVGCCRRLSNPRTSTADKAEEYSLVRG